MTTLLTGARLFTGTRILDDHALLLDRARILDLVPADAPRPDATTVKLPPGSLLVPGFIDAQVNGAGGVLFNDRPTAEAVRQIAAAVRRLGTTGILPTFITDDRDKMRQACQAAVAAVAQPGSGVLGLHLEGPFISPQRKGIHAARFIRTPDETDIAELSRLCPQLTANHGRLLLTLAPEQIEDATIARLAAAGIILAAGHTAASAARVRAALTHGIRGFTHLSNAMPPIVNRDPGPVIAALDDGDSWCGIIVDGHHVDPTLLRVMIAAKRPGKLFLVTDAMSPVGTDAERFVLLGQTVLRRDGRLVSEDGVLAGADIDMAQAVRNCVSLLGLPVTEALRMASLYPAEFLGLDHRLGRLAPGFQADLTLLDGDLSVLATWVGGDGQWLG
ncbi:MAG: N-acetylglucosamine-6-phosphate deacetylase [Azospirillaceae bacterium]|nr:N-acetylglucosamine-6-phosphate deacetylase [Azospirillaceae bacterium]